ncbi:MAG: hypothetical protein ABR585_15425 [Gemmatimonadaceae bacterium]
MEWVEVTGRTIEEAKDLALDELGVDYIEGGFPLSNPKDEAFFKDIRGMGLTHAKVAAFGFLVELAFLDGRSKLGGREVRSLLVY